MAFVDSFTNLKTDPPDPLVQEYVDKLNDFLDSKSEEFLDLWHEGEDSVLFFNLNEREKGGEVIRRTFCQIRDVLKRVPVPTRIEVSQITFSQGADHAYAVLMENAVSEMDQKTILTAERMTLIWRRFDGKYKLVHMHSDHYDPRQEAISELLRSTAGMCKP
jgi:ketosteroid isomerase-like protein